MCPLLFPVRLWKAQVKIKTVEVVPTAPLKQAWFAHASFITEETTSFLPDCAAVLDRCAEAIFVFDTEARCRWANRVAQAWTGTHPDLSHVVEPASFGWSAGMQNGARYARETGSIHAFLLESPPALARAIAYEHGVFVYVQPQTDGETEEQALRQRRAVLRDTLYAVSEGRLHLCDSESDLPAPLPEAAPTVDLGNGGIRHLRRQAREWAGTCGFDDERTDDFEVATGEAGMNAVVHAQGGQAQLRGCARRGTLQAWIQDKGRGIPDEYIHRATLEKGFTTAGSFGHGFWVILKTCNRAFLLTGPDGTTLVLEQDRAAV